MLPARPKSGNRCEKHDIYAYNPTYEWASHKTWVGVVLSWLSVLFIGFYIFISTRDYVVRPPELISQGDIDLQQVAQEYPFLIPKLGLRLTYNNVSNPDGPLLALHNENPYVRFNFRHVVMKNQQRIRETDMILEPCVVSNYPSLCPVTNSSYTLQGIYYKENYKFLEITVSKCTGDPKCAPLREINEKLASGEFRILARISMEAQQFDVEMFHKTGVGFTTQNRSLDYYALPNIELKADIVLQARQIQKEQRYIGSPPMPETRVDILSFFGRDTDLLPRLRSETSLMTFHIRLHESVRLEEVSYWCPSLLDLFGLWGAMASFIGSLSLGFCAMQYNKMSFQRHFKDATHEKRLEAQKQAWAAMNMVRNSTMHDEDSRGRNEMYNNLQAQYDALMVEPDLRLFETHHFNTDGRMAMSAAELKFPSTPFGELRRLALYEHGRKKRAAQFISMWYARHLVKKGFIKDPERKREIFRVEKGKYDIYSCSDNSSSASVTNDASQRSVRNMGGSGRFWSSMRRRRKSKPSQEEPSTADEEEIMVARLDAMERGQSPKRRRNNNCDESPLTAPTQSSCTGTEVQHADRVVSLEGGNRQPSFRIPIFHEFVFDEA